MSTPSFFHFNQSASAPPSAPPVVPRRPLDTRRVLTLAGVAIGALVLLSFLASGCMTINPGYVGIEVSKIGSSRGVQDLTIKTGLVLYDPLTTAVIEYPTFMQTAKWTRDPNEGSANDESLTFTTKDSLVVNADVSLSYQLDADKVPAFYVKFRADRVNSFTDGYMRNVARDAFNEVAGQYTVEQVMGDNAPLLKAVRERIQEQLKDYVTIAQLGFIGAPRPPQSVTDAINAKVQAEQIALQKQNEVAQAEAEARKQVAEAQGDAESNLVRAKADAEANRLRSSTLTPALIEWTKVQKWDGKNPSVVTGDKGGLMLSVK